MLEMYILFSFFLSLFGGEKNKQVPNLLTLLHKSLVLKASLQFENSTFHIPQFTGEVLSAVDNVSSVYASSVFLSL